MNLHIGYGLLSVCFTFVGYLPKILPRALEIFRELGDVLHDGHNGVDGLGGLLES
jgi:hypothetical protein